MIQKRITCPMDQPDCEFDWFDEDTVALVQFHCDGIGVDVDCWINDIFFDAHVWNTTAIIWVIAHFANCLHHQCMLEIDHFDDNNQVCK